MRNKAFTLIELLVVISIFSLLSATVLLYLKTQRGSAERAKSMQFSATINHALKAYSIGNWSFEDNLNDSSGNKNNGVWMEWWGIPGGSPTFAKGIINRGVEFDGSHYMLAPNSSTMISKSGALTIEFWLNPNEASGWGYFVCDSNWSFWCDRRNESFSCFFYDEFGNIGYFDITDVLREKTWTHVVLTYDSKNPASLKAFVDAKEYSPPENHLSSAFSQMGDFWIGGSEWGDNFYGMMDEVRLYDSYIKLAEVEKHYAQGLFKIRSRELAIK